MQALPTLGGNSTTVEGVSNTGVVYGSSTTADGSNHAFLYSNGQMLDPTRLLHSLGGSISHYTDYRIEGINDKGQVLVMAQILNSVHSFLLTPDGQPLPAEPTSVVAVTTTVEPHATPEPSALALFALVTVACGARRGVGPIRAFVSRAARRSGPTGETLA